MKLGKRGTMAVAATGLAVLTFDLAAVLALNSLLAPRVDAGHATVLARAGATVARRVAATAADDVARILGDTLLHAVRETSSIYGTLLRATPARPRVVRVRVVECAAPAGGAALRNRHAAGAGAVTKPDVTSRLWNRLLSLSYL